MTEMFSEEELKLAHEQGSAAGQVAVSEFVLKSYGHTLDPRLKQFLEKVKQDGYETVGEILGKPAEDVALQVSDILDKVVTITK